MIQLPTIESLLCEESVGYSHAGGNELVTQPTTNRIHNDYRF